MLALPQKPKSSMLRPQVILVQLCPGHSGRCQAALQCRLGRRHCSNYRKGDLRMPSALSQMQKAANGSLEPASLPSHLLAWLHTDLQHLW
jgi:hypothetical protein